MALTLAGVQSAFQIYVSRSDTDTYVTGILKTVQNQIVSEDYFDWSLDQNNRTQTLVASTKEYNLATLNPTWNIRKIKNAWFEEDDAGARRGKLAFRDLAHIREFYPDPAISPSEGIPEIYYILDDGKTIGFIPIPDAAYIVNFDLYVFPPDPAGNDLIIPENFELVVLSFLAYLWHKTAKDFEAANAELLEYRNFLKPLLTKDNHNQTKDVRRGFKVFNTHGRSIRNRQHYTDAEWESLLP